jgi:ankyrin repeat protein
VNAKAPDGGTALMMASQAGHREVVQALLTAKAEVNAKAANGDTAMSLAEKEGHPEIVQLLKASLPAPDK